MTGCASGAVRWSRDRASPAVWMRLAAHRCVAGRSSRWWVPPTGQLGGWLGVQDGQAPAPSGKLAGDRDHADRGALGSSVQPTPALVEPAVATLGPLPDHGGLTGLAALQLPAGPIRLAVMPGRLDQQPSGMAVAGLGDRPLDALETAGALGGDQPEIGADGGAGEALPVADLDRQPERGQDPDPRRQPSRPTSGAQDGVAASSPMAVSRRSRRACTASTAP